MKFEVRIIQGTCYTSDTRFVLYYYPSSNTKHLLLIPNKILKLAVLKSSCTT
jgi:hypothetical protein